MNVKNRKERVPTCDEAFFRENVKPIPKEFCEFGVTFSGMDAADFADFKEESPVADPKGAKVANSLTERHELQKPQAYALTDPKLTCQAAQKKGYLKVHRNFCKSPEKVGESEFLFALPDATEAIPCDTEEALLRALRAQGGRDPFRRDSFPRCAPPSEEASSLVDWKNLTGRETRRRHELRKKLSEALANRKSLVAHFSDLLELKLPRRLLSKTAQRVLGNTPDDDSFTASQLSEIPAVTATGLFGFSRRRLKSETVEILALCFLRSKGYDRKTCDAYLKEKGLSLLADLSEDLKDRQVAFLCDVLRACHQYLGELAEKCNSLAGMWSRAWLLRAQKRFDCPKVMRKLLRVDVCLKTQSPRASLLGDLKTRLKNALGDDAESSCSSKISQP